MKTYSDDLKARLIERMLAPQASVAQLARERGIPKDTLYTWRRQAQQARGVAATAVVGPAERWESKEKFAMVLETAALSEAERGEYCRKRGLYPEQLQSWRRACEQANTGSGTPPARAAAAGAVEQRRIRELERELRRKEKALAEAAALLVLRKKAAALWGRDEAE